MTVLDETVSNETASRDTEELTAMVEGLELSPQQRRLWQIGSVDDFVRCRSEVRAEWHERLDRKRLEEALTVLVERHEVLRLRFELPEGMNLPLQDASPERPLPLEIADLSSVSEPELEDRVRALLEERRTHVFDPRAGTLSPRALLIIGGEDHHQLVLEASGLAIDAAGLRLLLGDLLTCYAGLEKGQEPEELPEPSIPYLDLAGWFEDSLHSENAAAGHEYWRGRDLASLTSAPRLGQAIESMTELRSLPVTLPASSDLERFSSAHDLSSEAILLAAWGLLLTRLLGQETAPLGLELDGRNYAELDQVIGACSRVLPFPLALDVSANFPALVRKVEEALNAGRQWQECFTWETVLEEGSAAKIAEPPSWRFLIALDDKPSAYEMDGLRLDVKEAMDWSERFDLALRLNSDGSSAQLSFAGSRFTVEDAERVAAQYKALLDDALARPEVPCDRLLAVSPAEREAFAALHADATRRAGSSPPGLLERFTEQVVAQGEEHALIDGETRLTYAELDRLATALAHRLQAQGVGPETRVAILAERSLNAIVALFGVLRAGGAYVPIDPETPLARLSLLLESGGIACVVSAKREDLPVDLNWIDLETVLDGASSAAFDLPLPMPEQLAYGIFTSGSTGQPKLVGIEHRQIAHYLHGLLDRLPLAGKSAALVSTLAADLGNTTLFGALASGGRLHLFDPQTVMDPNAFATRMSREGVEALKIVPSHLEALLSADQPARIFPTELLILGGEALPERLLNRARELAPNCGIINHYGPTETTVGVLAAGAITSEEGAALGQPLEGTSVSVLDPALQLLPLWAPGELGVSGGALARGYLGDPAKTAQSFVPDPLSTLPGARLYRTGDRVQQRVDGRFQFLGRFGHQIKLRGYRIELGEIEAHVRALPDVREAVVLLREDRPGERQLVAYALREEGASQLDARAELAQRLPEPMVPSAVVELTRWPLTANGKIDRRALPEPRQTFTITPPRTPIERRLVELWGQVLEASEIGIDNNFFELGGDSILGIQLVARAHREGLSFTPRDLFRYPTIRELAEIVETSEDDGIDSERRLGEVPTTPIERWFFELDPAEAHHFNQSVLLIPKKRLDFDHLQEAVQGVAALHEALRLRFTRDPEQSHGWRQTLVAEPAASVSRIDLADDASSEAVDRAIAEIERSLDLEHGPLLHVAQLVGKCEDQDRLLFAAHHLVIDGVSWRVLLDDLAPALSAHESGETPRLIPPRHGFAAWADALHEATQSEQVQNEIKSWPRSTPQPEVLQPLPESGPVSNNTIGTMDVVRQGFDEATTRLLTRELTQHHGLRTDDLLLAALVRTLTEISGQRRVAIELEGHGREVDWSDLDLSRAVGWMTSRYPLVFEMPRSEEPIAAILAAKEKLRSVPSGGVAYGVTRYLGEAFADDPHPEVVFNNLGQFDALFDEQAPWRLAPEQSRHQRSPEGRRRQRLEVVASVVDGRLEIGWWFSTALDSAERVRAWSERFEDHLKSALDAASNVARLGYTPSDFPLAGVDQATLDRHFAPPVEIVDLYPLSPLQQGILFHTQQESGASYVSVSSCTLKGQLDIELFKRVWSQAIERHPILRTFFVWRDVDRPLQAVRKEVELPWTLLDWSERDSATQEEAFRDLLATGRVEGFALDRAPLYDLCLIRLGADPVGVEEYRLIWRRHHLLLDGWSTALLLGEILDGYESAVQGQAYEPPKRPPFREFVSWLQEQDAATASQFWRQTLTGFAEPTPIRVERQPPTEEPTSDEVSIRSRQLAAETFDALSNLARQHRLTLNTLGQGLWALFLAHQSERRDVVFGSVGSGRPPGLVGVDAMIGMFINTLPVRVRLTDDQAMVPWLQTLQNEQAEQRDFEHTPLVDSQAASDVPQGQPLFNTCFVFENYPDVGRVGEGLAGLDIEDLDHHIRNSFPLTLRMMPENGLRLDLLYDPRAFRKETVEHVLDRVERLFQRVPDLLEQDLAAAFACLEEGEKEHEASAREGYENAVMSRLKRRRRGGGDSRN